MEKTYYIYIHTLKSDGRRYIGLTCQNPEERWRKGRGYRGSTHFHHAIHKYGWDAFDHDIVFSTVDRVEAYRKEEELILKYNTTDEKKGFNLQSGGLTPVQSQESIEKSASKRRGKPVSPEALQNIRTAAKNRDNSVFSHPRSEETKRKISESHKGMTYGEETKQKLREAFGQPVLCVELNQVFPSMTEAAKAFGLSKCAISAVIKGRNKTAAGYHWKLI